MLIDYSYPTQYLPALPGLHPTDLRRARFSLLSRVVLAKNLFFHGPVAPLAALGASRLEVRPLTTALTSTRPSCAHVIAHSPHLITTYQHYTLGSWRGVAIPLPLATVFCM